jgi:hypothetical protein
VEAIVETVFSGARNAVVLVVEVGEVVLVEVDGEEADLELELVLELPQPASTRATPARARIDVLGTGMSPVLGMSGMQATQRDGRRDSRAGPQDSGIADSFPPTINIVPRARSTCAAGDAYAAATGASLLSADGAG